MIAPTLTALAQYLAWALVHFLWQGVLLGVVAWPVLALLRRRRAEVRYAAACVFLVGCLALPVVTFVLQGWWAGPAQGALTQAVTYHALMAFRSRVVQGLPLLLLVWGMGALVFGLRAFASWLWLQRLAHRALEVVDREAQALMRALQSELGVPGSVRLMESTRVRGPFVHGILKPIVFVPLGFVTGMDPVALKAVLAHELAHIRRFDVLVIGLQTLIETLLYYHPVTWWLSRRVTIERECCCDAIAAQACGDPVHLIRTLQRLDALQPLATPALAGGDLMERILRLLRRDPGAGRVPTPLLSVALAMSVTVILAQQPAVVDVLRNLPVVNAMDPVMAKVQQEVQGVTAAIQAPDVTLGAQGQPSMPPQDLPLASTFTQALALSPATVQAEPSPGAPPTTDPLAVRKIPVARIGIPLVDFFDRPIEPWPEGQRTVVADMLPKSSPPGELDWILGRPEVGRYAFTTWPKSTNFDWRFLRLNLPAGQRAEIRVVGTSGTVKDSHFSLRTLRLKTLIHGHWSLYQSGPRSGNLAVKNQSNCEDFVVLAINGPSDTPYRCELVFSGTEDLPHKEVGVPIDAWPEAESSLEVKDAHPTSEFGVCHVQATWVHGVGGDTSAMDPRTKPYVGTLSVNRLRCMEVQLQPGELARFSVAKGRALLEAATLQDGDPSWDRMVARANSAPERLRRKGLEVINPTQHLQRMVLVAYQVGPEEKGYRIDLDRIKGSAQ